jgi:hypothetical protein
MGLHLWVPLAWNICFAVLLLAVVDRIFQKLVPQMPPIARIVILLAVVFFSSLATMTFVGMEHIMQTLAFLLFVYLAARTLERTHTLPLSALATNESSDALWLMLAAAMNTLSRFEGTFIVAIVCLLLLVRHRFLIVAGVALSGAAPLAIFAFFSIRHGGHSLPNSLLMKAANKNAISHQLNLFGPNGLLGHYSRHNGLAELWIAAVLLLGLGIMKKINIPRSVQYALGIYAATVFLHCQFSRLGALGRYEFYLIVAGIVFCGSALITAMHDVAPNHVNSLPWLSGLGAVLLSLCLVPRTLGTWHETVRYSEFTYADAVGNGRFMQNYYDNASVVANDVGAISYFSHVQCLDLAALGSNEVTDLVLRNDLNRATVYHLAQEHHARIALVFKSRFFSATNDPDLIPADWIEIGHIDFPDFPEVHTAYFMAVDPTEAAPLRQHLQEFFQHLPPEARPFINP